MTDLIHLVKNKKFKQVRDRISQGANVNLVDEEQSSLLHWSVLSGDFQLTNLILQKGANPNAQNKFGCTPLELAINYDEEAIVDLLLKNEAKLFNRNGYMPLHAAAVSGNIALLEKFLTVSTTNSRDDSGRTPLHWASQEGHWEAAAYLIKNGADKDALDHEGFSPLSIAVSSGDQELFELLVNMGARLEGNLLHAAVSWNHTAIVKSLVTEGFNPNQQDQYGNTPLHYAYLNKRKKIITYLIGIGCSQLHKNMDGLLPSEMSEDKE